MNHHTPFIAFSLVPAVSRDGAERLAEIAEEWRHQGHTAKLVAGSYKGEVEPALILGEPEKALEAYGALLRADRQESVLIVHSDRSADLIYLSTKVVEPLGIWRETSAEFALAQDAYTYDILADRYYCVIGVEEPKRYRSVTVGTLEPEQTAERQIAA